MGTKSSKEINDLLKEKSGNVKDGGSKTKNGQQDEHIKNKIDENGVGNNNNNNNQNHNQNEMPPYFSTMTPLMANMMYSQARNNTNNPYATYHNTPKHQKSRLRIDVNDPLLMSTLPPHLTSVFNINENNSNNRLGKQIPQQTHTPDTELIDSVWRQLNKPMQNNTKPTKSLMLQELLECPICMNRYDDPHVLPCQHTFCKSCIVTLNGNSRNDDNRINCPICRETHVLTNGIDALPANYTMKRLIELEAMAAAEKEADLEKAKLRKQRHNSRRHHDREVRNIQTPPPPPSQPHYQTPRTPVYRTPPESNYSPAQTSRRYEKKYYKTHQDNIVYSKSESDHNKFRLKLILLCHSSAIDSEYDQSHNYDDHSSVHPSSLNSSETYYEDEYGKCKTFSKIGVMSYDRIEKLKGIVEEKFGIPYDEQLLVYKDKILRNDTKQLINYRLRNYSRIHVFDKRDVKENLDEINDEQEGPYYIDEDFFKELSNMSRQRNQSKSKSRVNLNESEFYVDQVEEEDNRYRTPSRHPYHHDTHNTVKRRDTVNGKRVRKLNELFENNMSVK